MPPRNITFMTLSENMLGGAGGYGTVAAASAAWPAANEALYIPFRLYEPMLVKQLVLYNGSTASGNWDLGIFSVDGKLIVAKGATTAQSGTSALQLFDITDTVLQPGLYYIGVACSNTTGQVFRWNPGATQCEAMGMASMAAGMVSAALVDATFAATARNFVPFVGVTGQATM